MNVPRRVGYIVAGLVIAGLLFQLFFRYQYVHLTGTTVMRIDRLSGSSCNLPCEQPSFDPTTAKPEHSFDSDDQEAIQGVKSSVAVPYTNDGHDYKWRVSQRGKNDGTHYEITTAAPQFIDAPGPNKTGRAKGGSLAAELGVTPPASDDTPAPFAWGGENPADWPVRLICYCYNDTPGQTEPAGFFWEYHLDTRQTYSVDDNAALSVKYGMTPRK